MATKKLSAYNRHVKAFAKAHPNTKGPALMKAASKSWSGKSHPKAAAAKKSASKAHRAAKRRIGYDPSKVILRKVKTGAHTGGKSARRIGRGLFALPRNPGDYTDRVKRAFSGATVGTAAGALGGGAAAALLPMIGGRFNSGWSGVGLSALASIIAAGGAVIFFPAAAVPVAAGGIAVTGVRAAVVGIPRAFAAIANTLAEWATPAASASGTQGAYRSGAQGAYAKEKGVGAYRQPRQLAGGVAFDAPARESGMSVAAASY